MKTEGEALRVRVYIGESDQWHGKPLFAAIVERCRQKGLAGATVLRGIEGYGAHTQIHTARILRLAEELPVVIDIVDRAGRIEHLLPILDETVTEGLITLEHIHVVKYVRGAASDAASETG
jgi:PII-like signaling protein